MNPLVKIIYVEHNGETRAVEVKVGQSVMAGAVHNNVPGIEADCGGSCACGTCQVVIDEAWRSRTGEPDMMEQGMLDFAGKTAPGARLSCQILVTESLEGLTVHVPTSQ